MENKKKIILKSVIRKAGETVSGAAEAAGNFYKAHKAVKEAKNNVKDLVIKRTLKKHNITPSDVRMDLETGFLGINKRTKDYLKDRDSGIKSENKKFGL